MMKECIVWCLSFLLIFSTNLTSSSQLKIVNNGYENLLISLPRDAEPTDKTKLVENMKVLLDQSSALLQDVTKGRSQFRSVTFLVPQTWGDIETWLPDVDNETTFEDAGAALYREGADVIVTSDLGARNHPYTLHQGGCGRRSRRIYLPSSFLLTESEREKNVTFVRLWSEFRYGIFPEGGFEGDEMYPSIYHMPGEEGNKTTGCNFPLEVNSKEDGEKEFLTSIMDQNVQSKRYEFCQGVLSLTLRHDAESPSKQNLICNEEGAWFTVLRSPDFKHGKNAAPMNKSSIEVSFRFVKEVLAPKVIVAIDISSRMADQLQQRYTLTKNAFSRFVLSDLPAGSELSLLVFGGEDRNVSIITESVVLEDIQSRIEYLEGQPLSDDPLQEEDVCVDCALEQIIELLKDNSSEISSSPTIVLVTTRPYFNTAKYNEIQNTLQNSEIRLRVLSFLDYPENLWEPYHPSPLYKLCLETGNEFVYLEGDVLGNLYRGFAGTVKGPSANVLVSQDYIITLDEENIWIQFTLDGTLSETMTILLSGPLFDNALLEYAMTTLKDPNGQLVHLQKQELIPAWMLHLKKPNAGEYTLKTRRKEGAISPILYSVTGSAASKQETVTVNVWVEVLESKVSPAPVQIFAEVKQGNDPIKNATVIAYIRHPGDDGTSEVPLIDDGLGSADITEGDGVYSHFFTNFTSTGFYNVYVHVTGGFEDDTQVLKGPVSDCCGSIFQWRAQSSTHRFQREAGPATFEVPTVPDEDIYPPGKVTNLGIVQAFDQIIVLRWIAVGDDYDTGVAAAYEIKLFRNRSSIRHRFFDSVLQLHSETVESTPLATYGTSLYHVLKLPQLLDRGLYYISIRALDDAKNAGDPSNAIPIWVERNKSSIHCGDEPIAMRRNSASEYLPLSILVLFAVILVIL